MPTRFSENNATLIDHMFLKSYNNLKPFSAILVRKISDHLPFFCSLPLNTRKKIDTPKFVWKTKNNQRNLSNLNKNWKQLIVTMKYY